jgi:hypothetical protein
VPPVFVGPLLKITWNFPTVNRVERAMPSTVHWIRDPRQVAALASRVRQRVMDRLEAIGPASVAQIAQSLGLAPDRLYYHVGLLQRHGLLRRVGSQGEGRGEEATFDLPARRWHLRYDPDDPGLVAALRKLTHTMLRQAGRDFDSGWADPALAVHGTLRNLWSLRLEASLSRAELRELNGHLQAIVALLRRPRRTERGQLVALTWILAPVSAGSPPEEAA